MKPHSQLAQDLVSRYSFLVDPYESNCFNVEKHLRKPIEAVTLYILRGEDQQTVDLQLNPNDSSNQIADFEEMKTDWRDYLAQGVRKADDLPDFEKIDLTAYATLGRRTKARVEAFLSGVSVAVSSIDPNPAPSSSAASDGNTTSSSSTKKIVQRVRASANQRDITLNEGLAGYKPEDRKSKASIAPDVNNISKSSTEKRARSSGTTEEESNLTPEDKRSTFSTLNVGSKQIFRAIAPSKAVKKAKFPQIAKDELTTRVELYIRSLCRVKCQGKECVVAAEPARALKARARSIVVAFVDTVDTVQQQSPVLTRLLKILTKELLAVDYIAPDLCGIIKRLVADYVQSVSFASLAFLTSPESSAATRLSPTILSYLRFLQMNWESCVRDCELERMLTCSINPDLRHTLKNIEFTSIGHLLEVCHAFRKHLHNIEISPDNRVGHETVDDNEALRQALRDLKREVITINGNNLPPIKNRKQLLTFLTQSLNSRVLASGISRKKRLIIRSKSETVEASESETDFSSADDRHVLGGQIDDSRGIITRRKRNFQLSTVDYLTKRLLLAASRTGTGGDAYFVVRDLFGGENVEVVPSKNVHNYSRNLRSGSIEIIVKLASVTIKCHGSFDVYPKSLVGEVEPLIQLHTTTTEVIALQEVRVTDSSGEGGAVEDEYSSDDSDKKPFMVVQERKTDRTGWRFLCIRPALYEQVEEFSTPS